MAVGLASFNSQTFDSSQFNIKASIMYGVLKTKMHAIKVNITRDGGVTHGQWCSN